MIKEFKLFIGGQWIEGSSKKFIDVENPAIREIIARVPEGNEDDVNKAVCAAQKAFPIWSKYSAGERSACIKKIGEYFENNKEEICNTITEEIGAPKKMVMAWHIESAINEANFFAEVCSNFNYEVKKDGVIIRREPIGVVAGLTPWNYPLDQITVKILPALAAGNCIVLKPSQLAPLTAIHVAKAIEYAGIPKGVFNIVTGRGGEVGNVLASHEDIKMISFTGSTVAGKEVGRLALNNIKKIALELGGKSASVLLDESELTNAVSATLNKCFMNTGQTCSAFTRFVVPRRLKNIIEKLMIVETEKFIVGDPLNKNTDIGPLINLKAFNKVKKYIQTGLDEGAKMLVGKIPNDFDNGYYVYPVIFTEVTSDMTIANEEIFGPVLCVIYYDDIDEALSIVNNSTYGLSGAVFGKKHDAYNFAKKMETGVVHINGAPFTVKAPFGGYKQSGIGRENSEYSFDEYLEIKALLVN